VDYDNDGDLDLAVAGCNDAAKIFKIYRNDAAVLFCDLNLALPSFAGGGFDWGDFDNDGDLDVVFTGYTDATGPASGILRNDGAGVFTDIAAGLVPLHSSQVKWGDYDNDGDLDIAIAGGTTLFGDDVTARVYRNDGAAGFTAIPAGLPGVKAGSLAWGDCDNDGDLDLAISGRMGPLQYFAGVFRNDDGGLFTDLQVVLGKGNQSSLDWGDYDNDGWIDLARSGFDDPPISSNVFRNDQGHRWVLQDHTLPGTSLGCIRWADYDADGDLDLALIGSGSGPAYSVCEVFRSSGIFPVNLPPSPPSGLTAAPASGDVILSWNASTDAETPSLGLSYNIRVGTVSGGNNIVSGMALPSGVRLLPRLGNAQKNLSRRLKSLPAGTYYWSVQAIDGGYRGSAWAAESTFTKP
jgi:hypothetical protein